MHTALIIMLLTNPNIGQAFGLIGQVLSFGTAVINHPPSPPAASPPAPVKR